MKLNNMVTAEEFLNNYRFKAGEYIGNSDFDTMAQYAKDFAKLHIKEAIRAMATAQIPALFEDKIYLEQFVNHVLREVYPLDQKVI